MLQIAWDSTSLGALKTCPRLYELSILRGFQPRSLSVHLVFGLHYHAALERFDHARAEGASYETALRAAVRYVLEATWDSAKGRPWHSDDPNKNRLTLVRTVIWYLEQFNGPEGQDSLETILLDNGKPAVELSFRLQTDYIAADGQNFMLCGHLDRLALYQGDHIYIVDRKTTKSTISESYFAHYSPDNQMSLYDFAGRIVYDQPIRGIIVDAAQVAVTFSRFQRGFVPRNDFQRDEWYKDLGVWLSIATSYASLGYWPQNDKACGNYGGCAFREICSLSPNVREDWLKSKFYHRTWDPLQIRGDI